MAILTPNFIADSGVWYGHTPAERNLFGAPDTQGWEGLALLMGGG